jgi:hypothetical protein
MSATFTKNPYYVVRNSRIHGRGVFAVANIPKGTRITEYVGDRISHAEADRRHEDKAPDDNHTFLFTVNSRVVIDGGVKGNDARWINHSCDPNCESVVDKSRVFLEAVRDIPKGQEICFDYMIERDPNDPPEMDQIFGCRCGSPKCRGTMLIDWPEPKKKAGKSVKKKAASRNKVGKTQVTQKEEVVKQSTKKTVAKKKATAKSEAAAKKTVAVKKAAAKKPAAKKKAAAKKPAAAKKKVAAKKPAAKKKAGKKKASAKRAAR